MKKQKIKKTNEKIDFSIVFAVIMIIIIIIGLVFATIIRMDYDPAQDKLDEPSGTSQADALVAKQNARTYIDFLEANYRESLDNDPNYVVPDNVYITEVDTNLGLGVYPTSVHLFILAGRVQKGTITISGYTFEYQDGGFILQ